MSTLLTSNSPNDCLVQPDQLVLFPDVIRIPSLPPATYQQVETPPRPEERPYTYQQAVEAGQLPLFC